MQFELILFGTSLDAAITQAQTEAIDYDFTITVTRDGTVINSIVIPTMTDIAGSYSSGVVQVTFNRFDATAFQNLGQVQEDDVVGVNLAMTRPDGETWTFGDGAFGLQLFFTGPELFTSVPKPSTGVSAYLTSDNPDNAAADINGGLGLKLNRTTVFSGSVTDTVTIESFFLIRFGANILVTVQWDDSTARTTGDPESGGYARLMFNRPTFRESMALPLTGPTNARDEYDFSETAFTWDGRLAGTVRMDLPGGNIQSGGLTINTSNQSTAISNFRIVEVSYEYTS